MTAPEDPDSKSVTIHHPDRTLVIAGVENVVWFSPRSAPHAEVGLMISEDGTVELLLGDGHAHLSQRGLEKYQDLLRSLSEIVRNDQFRARVEGGAS
ncbi:hypothetical protein [Rhodococcus sp. KRD162]|uniref:hypothetical protein n=1 Tax=Rhodococcus sp. KRD162 TaxID=2729725 RepID=UPI003D01D841